MLVLAIFAGSVLQRITGMGFALVAAPFIVLIAGPVTGVILVTVCGALTSATVLVRVLRHVEWKKFFLLVPAAFAGIAPGALIVEKVQESVCGFMKATTGVGGPALSVYAITTRWAQSEFAVTMQPQSRRSVSAPSQ